MTSIPSESPGLSAASGQDVSYHCSTWMCDSVLTLCNPAVAVPSVILKLKQYNGNVLFLQCLSDVIVPNLLKWNFTPIVIVRP